MISRGVSVGIIRLITVNFFVSQAEFSLVTWPFSLKLLWAPIVDTFYSKRFGRRKSWLVPAQYVIGLFMLFLGANVDSWLGEDVSTRIE